MAESVRSLSLPMLCLAPPIKGPGRTCAARDLSAFVPLYDSSVCQKHLSLVVMAHASRQPGSASVRDKRECRITKPRPANALIPCSRSRPVDQASGLPTATGLKATDAPSP